MRLLDDIRLNYWDRIGTHMRKKLSETQVVVADQVTEYFFAMNDKEYWDVEDFPNVAPPFENFWVETSAPSKIVSEEHGVIPWRGPSSPLNWRGGRRPSRWGALFLKSPIENMLEDSRLKMAYPREEVLENVAHWVNITLFLEAENATSAIWAWGMPVKKDGTIWTKFDPVLNERVSGLSYTLIPEQKEWLNEPGGHEAYRNMRSEAHTYIHPLLLAVCFMHAKNVTLTHHEPSRGMVRKQLRRGRVPPLAYKVLEVGPIARILNASNKSGEGTDLKLALHRCRGHFKTYTQDAPLLGRHAGSFFWAEQWRGKPEDGHAVRKEYHVKEKK
jgi:hypothetical protein